MTKVKKCIVKDCKNTDKQGNFVSDLCVPCWEFITKGRGTHSQAYRNALKTTFNLVRERMLNKIITRRRVC